MKAADLHQTSEGSNPEWTTEDFARAHSLRALTSALQAKLLTRGPQKAPSKSALPCGSHQRSLTVSGQPDPVGRPAWTPR